MLVRVQRRLTARSAAVLATIESRLPQIMTGWLMLSAGACTLRIAASPHAEVGRLETWLPYLLLIGAPLGSMWLALRWFAAGDRMAQPVWRLARVGQWRDVSPAEARAHPLYGASGIMVSLLVGMLVNVVVRSAEYLVAMPAVSGDIPAWLGVLHTLMTFDVVMLSALYAVAFAAALRRAPIFPRLLVAAWALDLFMQLTTGAALASAPGLPHGVATALGGLLAGNVKKVLISIALWLPYLLLSKRVNVTYRRRLPA